jgi:hypothetical protein
MFNQKRGFYSFWMSKTFCIGNHGGTVIKLGPWLLLPGRY